MYRKENNGKQIIISGPLETVNLLWLGGKNWKFWVLKFETLKKSSNIKPSISSPYLVRC